MKLLVPSPDEVYPAEAFVAKDEIKEIPCTKDAPLSAFVFKTVADPFVGKMSYIKVMSGTLKANTEILNSTTGYPEKIGKLYNLCGKKTDRSRICCGW